MDNIIKKTHQFLVDNGIADTFQFIKSLDTIELTGTSENEKERVLLNDIIDEYGKDTVVKDIAFQFLIPCIPEGVIKSRTRSGAIYYTHFKVVAHMENKFDLEIKEYHFHDGDFYLRYIIKMNKIGDTVNENYDEELSVNFSCVKQFLLDTFSKKELENVFSDEEIEWLVKTAQNDDDKLSDTITTIMLYVLTTFQAINFLSSDTLKNRENSTCKIPISVINNKDNYIDSSIIRNINVSNYFNIKLGSKKYLSSSKNKKIIRKTDKWIVHGHVRHYKSGKVVFVEAYYKGPNRKSALNPKTTFRFSDVNKSE